MLRMPTPRNNGNSSTTIEFNSLNRNSVITAKRFGSYNRTPRLATYTVAATGFIFSSLRRKSQKSSLRISSQKEESALFYLSRNDRQLYAA